MQPVNRELLPRSGEERERCARTVYVANVDERLDAADVSRFFSKFCGGYFGFSPIIATSDWAQNRCRQRRPLLQQVLRRTLPIALQGAWSFHDTRSNVIRIPPLATHNCRELGCKQSDACLLHDLHVVLLHLRC